MSDPLPNQEPAWHPAMHDVVEWFHKQEFKTQEKIYPILRSLHTALMKLDEGLEL